MRASGKATPFSKQTQAAYASMIAGAAAAQPCGYTAYGTAQQPSQVTGAQRASTTTSVYQQYTPSTTVAPSQTISAYAPPIQPSASAQQLQQPYQPITQMQVPITHYASTSPYAPQQSVRLPTPPPPITSSQSMGGIAPSRSQGVTMQPPLPRKHENGGWNDAPVIGERRGTPQGQHKPAAIISPFPNQMSSPGSAPLSPALHGSQQPLPPPPRPGSVQEVDLQRKCRHWPHLEGFTHPLRDLIQSARSRLLSRTHQHLTTKRTAVYPSTATAKSCRTGGQYAPPVSTTTAWTFSQTTRTWRFT